MKSFFIIYLLLFFSTTGCRQGTSKTIPRQLINSDSLLRIIYTQTDSFKSNNIYTFCDPQTLLEKYITGDTTFLKNSIRTNKELHNRESLFSHFDSCIRKTDLRLLDCNEAYQYEYKGSLFLNGYYITAYRKEDEHIIDFYRYTQGRDDSTICKIDYQVKKKLTPNEWEGLLEKIHYADFWGLKPENDFHGVDGYTETVFGYKFVHVPYQQEKVKKYNFVYRWSPYNTVFAEIGRYLVELGGEKIKY